MYLMRRLLVEVGGQQVGVPRLGAAVAADVEVVALLGGDQAEVLALGLGTFADAAGDGRLDLVRRADAPVALLDPDGEADGVLHAVAAPGRADAALDRAQRLAVGVAALEAGVDQLLPDVGQLLDRRAEQIDALAAGDLGVEAVLLGDLAQDDELLGRDLAAGNARHDRVRARRAGCWRGSGRWCPGASRGRSRMFSFHRLARIEATAGLQISQPWPLPCAAMQLVEGLDLLDLDDLEQLLPGVREVLAEVLVDRLAGRLQLAP